MKFQLQIWENIIWYAMGFHWLARVTRLWPPVDQENIHTRNAQFFRPRSRNHPLSRSYSLNSKEYCTLGWMPFTAVSNIWKISFCYLSKFLRWSLLIIFNLCIQIIVFIFIVIFTAFWPIHSSAFFRCFMSN